MKCFICGKPTVGNSVLCASKECDRKMTAQVTQGADNALVMGLASEREHRKMRRQLRKGGCVCPESPCPVHSGRYRSAAAKPFGRKSV